MNDEWGPWIEHDGNGCPCVGAFVHVVAESRHSKALFEKKYIAGTIGPKCRSWDRRYRSEFSQIIRYRIRKPRGLTILEEVANSIECPTKRELTNV